MPHRIVTDGSQFKIQIGGLFGWTDLLTQDAQRPGEKGINYYNTKEQAEASIRYLTDKEWKEV